MRHLLAYYLVLVVITAVGCVQAREVRLNDRVRGELTVLDSLLAQPSSGNPSIRNPSDRVKVLNIDDPEDRSRLPTFENALVTLKDRAEILSRRPEVRGDSLILVTRPPLCLSWFLLQCDARLVPQGRITDSMLVERQMVAVTDIVQVVGIKGTGRKNIVPPLLLGIVVSVGAVWLLRAYVDWFVEAEERCRNDPQC